MSLSKALLMPKTIEHGLEERLEVVGSGVGSWRRLPNTWVRSNNGEFQSPRSDTRYHN
jgi:hypothetical protein